MQKLWTTLLSTRDGSFSQQKRTLSNPWQLLNPHAGQPLSDILDSMQLVWLMALPLRMRGSWIQASDTI